MLNDNYDISIVGKQYYGSDIDSGEISLNTTGSYTKRGNARFIAYKEYDDDDPTVSRTAVLKVEKDCVTMMRGQSATRLILEKGKRNYCLYDMGFGSLTVGIFTSVLDSSLNDTGGELSVKYTLDIDSNLSSSNELEVKVKPRMEENTSEGVY